MIISDRHKFVLVHIPKCAGTLIRRVLEPFEDAPIGANRTAAEAELGPLDPIHIPLFVMRNYFEDDFAKLQAYWSFTAVRDPYSRFSSSLAQRLRKYAGERTQDLSVDEVSRAINEAIRFLSSQPRQHHLLPAEYIHFQRQVDYIFLDGRPYVDSVFSVRNLDQLFDRVRARVGDDCWQAAKYEPEAKANKTMVYRSGILGHLAGGLRPALRVIRRLLPQAMRQQLQSKIYVSLDQRFAHLFAAQNVREFIEDYEDIAFVQRLP